MKKNRNESSTIRMAVDVMSCICFSLCREASDSVEIATASASEYHIYRQQTPHLATYFK